MSQSLETWLQEMPARLDRAKRRPEAHLRTIKARVEEQVRQRAHHSVAAQTTVTADGDSVSLTSTAPQAGLLEHGGTVHGKPWLAVPIGGAQGLPGPRLDPLARFVFHARDGRLFLGAKVAGKLIARWRLIHQVTVPAEPWLAPSLDAALDGQAQALATDVSRAIMGRA